MVDGIEEPGIAAQAGQAALGQLALPAKPEPVRPGAPDSPVIAERMRAGAAQINLSIDGIPCAEQRGDLAGLLRRGAPRRASDLPRLEAGAEAENRGVRGRMGAEPQADASTGVWARAGLRLAAFKEMLVDGTQRAVGTLTAWCASACQLALKGGGCVWSYAQAVLVALHRPVVWVLRAAWQTAVAVATAVWGAVSAWIRGTPKAASGHDTTPAPVSSERRFHSYCAALRERYELWRGGLEGKGLDDGALRKLGYAIIDEMAARSREEKKHKLEEERRLNDRIDARRREVSRIRSLIPQGVSVPELAAYAHVQPFEVDRTSGDLIAIVEKALARIRAEERIALGHTKA